MVVRMLAGAGLLTNSVLWKLSYIVVVVILLLNMISPHSQRTPNRQNLHLAWVWSESIAHP